LFPGRIKRYSSENTAFPETVKEKACRTNITKKQALKKDRRWVI
jgi:hypothetical protein